MLKKKGQNKPIIGNTVKDITILLKKQTLEGISSKRLGPKLKTWPG